MPIIKSAIKRMHTSNKRRARNVGLKQNIKEANKTFRAKPSAEALSKAQSTLDIAVKKKLLKIGTASRRKAQLAKEAKAAGVKLVPAKKKPAVKKTAAKPVSKKVISKKPAVKTSAAKSPAKKPAAKKQTVKKPAAKK